MISILPLAASDRDLIRGLADASERATGHEALNEATWVDITHPGPDSAGFLATGEGRLLGYAHVARADNTDGTVAGEFSVGLVVDPSTDPDTIVAPLLDAVAAHATRIGGTTLVLWRFAPTAAEDARLRAAGFTPVRELYQMRVPLPLAEVAHWPEGISLRMFEPGRDDEAWLGVNNRAFRSHAEQGGWTVETLQRRMAEEWFDPSLFLLAVDHDGILGFNWCKLHEATATEPVLGEIFVIGVDDRARGRRVGRPLAVTGLDLMAKRDAPVGMLYCASDNQPALRLYRSLGFGVHRVDRAYERQL